MKVIISTPDISITDFSPDVITINKIEAGTTASGTQSIYLDVVENFDGLLDFDFEIYSDDVLYWTSSVVDFPVGINQDTYSMVEYYRLDQNYPNPFNPSTVIEYSIPVVRNQMSEVRRSGENIVTLKIYDVLGREVAALVNEHQRPGSYKVSFDASGLSSGVYYYQLNAGLFIETKKMLLLK